MGEEHVAQGWQREGGRLSLGMPSWPTEGVSPSPHALQSPFLLEKISPNLQIDKLGPVVNIVIRCREGIQTQNPLGSPFSNTLCP